MNIKSSFPLSAFFNSQLCCTYLYYIIALVPFITTFYCTVTTIFPMFLPFTTNICYNVTKAFSITYAACLSAMILLRKLLCL